MATGSNNFLGTLFSGLAVVNPIFGILGGIINSLRDANALEEAETASHGRLTSAIRRLDTTSGRYEPNDLLQMAGYTPMSYGTEVTGVPGGENWEWLSGLTGRGPIQASTGELYDVTNLDKIFNTANVFGANVPEFTNLKANLAKTPSYTYDPTAIRSMGSELATMLGETGRQTAGTRYDFSPAMTEIAGRFPDTDAFLRSENLATNLGSEASQLSGTADVLARYGGDTRLASNALRDMQTGLARQRGSENITSAAAAESLAGERATALGNIQSQLAQASASEGVNRDVAALDAIIRGAGLQSELFGLGEQLGTQTGMSQAERALRANMFNAGVLNENELLNYTVPRDTASILANFTGQDASAAMSTMLANQQMLNNLGLAGAGFDMGAQSNIANLLTQYNQSVPLTGTMINQWMAPFLTGSMSQPQSQSSGSSLSFDPGSMMGGAANVASLFI